MRLKLMSAVAILPLILGAHLRSHRTRPPRLACWTINLVFMPTLADPTQWLQPNLRLRTPGSSKKGLENRSWSLRRSSEQTRCWHRHCAPVDRCRQGRHDYGYAQFRRGAGRISALAKEKNIAFISTRAVPVSDLTGKACTPNTISIVYDTYMLANGHGQGAHQGWR